jgi:hypothetical protein
MSFFLLKRSVFAQSEEFSCCQTELQHLAGSLWAVSTQSSSLAVRPLSTQFNGPRFGEKKPIFEGLISDLHRVVFLIGK